MIEEALHLTSRPVSLRLALPPNPFPPYVARSFCSPFPRPPHPMLPNRSPEQVRRSTPPNADLAIRYLFFLLVPLLGLALFPVVGPAAARVGAQEASANRPSLSVGVLEGDLELDGILSEAVWRNAPAIENLTMIEPVEGGDLTGLTTVQVLANSRYLVIGVQASDPNPDGIVSTSKARDPGVESGGLHQGRSGSVPGRPHRVHLRLEPRRGPVRRPGGPPRGRGGQPVGCGVGSGHGQGLRGMVRGNPNPPSEPDLRRLPGSVGLQCRAQNRATPGGEPVGQSLQGRKNRPDRPGRIPHRPP